MVEDTYREYRSVVVDVRPLPGSTLPEDMAAVEVSPPIATLILPIDVQVAVVDPPSTTFKRLCIDGVDTGVTLRLDVALSERLSASRATLFVKDCEGVLSDLPLLVSVPITFAENDCVIGSGTQTLRGQMGSEYRPVLLDVRALLAGVSTKVRLSLSGRYIFGGTVHG